MGDRKLIITDTLINVDGTIEEREIEVDNNYFDTPAQDDITTEQIIDALLGVE